LIFILFLLALIKGECEICGDPFIVQGEASTMYTPTVFEADLIVKTFDLSAKTALS